MRLAPLGRCDRPRLSPANAAPCMNTTPITKPSQARRPPRTLPDALRLVRGRHPERGLGSFATFGDEGRGDRADADLERRAAAGLLDSIGGSPEQPDVIPAAARCQSAGFRWRPFQADIEAALAVHRLRQLAD